MALSQRMCGPVLTTVSSAASDLEIKSSKWFHQKRMEVRRMWQGVEALRGLTARIQSYIDRQTISPKTRDKIAAMFSGYTDYADMDYDRTEEQEQSFNAIELYFSLEGYELLNRAFHAALEEQEGGDDDIPVIAAALVEFITIELYNFRLSNIGDPQYANFEGVVFRGMCVSGETASRYKALASKPDLSQRSFDVPIGFVPTSASAENLEALLQQYSMEDQMHWVIHVHGLDPRLAEIYEEKYPDTAITSIGAMPISRISELREEEILLSSCTFHIVQMDSTERDGRIIHSLQLVVMNASCDHSTQLAKGKDDAQTNFYQHMLKASRFQICANLAKQFSEVESVEYESLANEVLKRLNATFPLNTALGAH